MNILSKSNTIISDIINRILNSQGSKELCVYGETGGELSGLYTAIDVRRTESFQDDISSNVVYLHIMDSSDLERVMPWIIEYVGRKDVVLYISRRIEVPEKYRKILGNANDIAQYSNLAGTLYLTGPTFQIAEKLVVPDKFKVLAVIHFYNEMDIIENTIQYLLEQELDLYLLDNWSEDGSYEVAKKYQKLYPERIYLEQFPLLEKSENYEWYSQLERTEQISKSLDYDWFIHYDMDEMRMSPWEDVPLRRAIYWIDQQGYNCIENTVVDFRYTEQDTENIFMKDVFFDFRHERRWFNHLKTWKKSEQIELKSSGGHHAYITDPKIYPLKFLNRHYPLRSIEQAEKKIFRDRMPRFRKENAERGWHTQYNQIERAQDTVYHSSELLFWGKDTFQKLYVPFFLECGIRWVKETSHLEVDFLPFSDRKIIIYGAGYIGKRVYQTEMKRNYIIGWGDKSYETLPNMLCEKIISIREAVNMEFDYIVIAIKGASVQQEVRMQLNGFGVSDEKIICV